MRIRTIKPEFWQDKRVASWDHFTRLLFIGLWSAADDHGIGSAEPARLAASLFPFDLSRDPREILALITRALATLSNEGRITIYTSDGEEFFEISNWAKHQKIDRPTKSRLPRRCGILASPSRVPRVNVASGSGIRDQGSGIPPNPPDGGSGGEQPTSTANGSEHPQPSEPVAKADPRLLLDAHCDAMLAAPAQPDPNAALNAQAERVWAAWPKRIEQMAALVAIREAIQRDGFDAVMAGTRAVVEADARRNASPPGRYLPRPTEFFGQARYLDDPAQYGPREAGVGGVPLGIRVRELARQLDAHPGNPCRQSPEAAEERDWWRLYQEVQAARVELLDAEGEPLAVRVDQGRALVEMHLGNPENTLGSLSAKEQAGSEWRILKKKVKALREMMRGANGEGGNHE